MCADLEKLHRSVARLMSFVCTTVHHSCKLDGQLRRYVRYFKLEAFAVCPLLRSCGLVGVCALHIQPAI